MNAYLLFDSLELWHIAGWTMLHSLWLGTLVGLAAAALRFLLHRASANVRYAVAVTTIALLAVLPVGIAGWLFTSWPDSLNADRALAAQGLFAAPSLESAAVGPFNDQIIELSGRETALPDASALPGLSDGGAPATLARRDSITPRPVPVRDRETGFETTSSKALSIATLCVPYLPWVWLVGAPITFGLLATGMVGTRRLRRASRAIEDGLIPELLARLVASMRIGRRVSIAVCERIATPVLVGIVRPIILLPPAALTGWSPDEIEMVLLHELAHVRRWDNAVNLAQRIVESLLFFHPAVWLVSNWIRREREACCDAVVVGRTNRPHAYAELLVALAAQMPRSVLFHPAASSAMAAGPLRKRIRHILQLEDDPMLVSGKSFVMVLASLLVAATLAVLYLPSIGQAEESTAQETDSTTEPKESATEATENTESTENSNENQDPTSNTETVELSTERLELNTPGGEVVIEADDEPDRIRIRSGDATPGTNKPSSGVVVDEQSIDGDKTASEEWLRGVVFASPKDGEIAWRAWKELGIKVVPASDEELEAVRRAGFRGGLKLLGLEDVMNIEGPLLMTQIQSKRLATGVGDFTALERALDALASQPSDEPIVLHGMKKGGGIFQYSMRRPRSERNARDPHSDLLFRDILDLQRKKVALERQLNQMQTEFANNKERLPNTRSESAQLLQLQLDKVNGALEAALRALASRVETSVDLETRAAELKQVSKFPSLEEQKLADLAYKRLELELEPIGDDELQRVKSLGYDGGVKVTQAVGDAQGPFQPQDILVGLHVWPTTNLQQVAEVLSRPDLAELNPLKFYVVRRQQPMQMQGGMGGYGGGYGARRGSGGDAYGGYGGRAAQGPSRPASDDIVVTGRIQVILDTKSRRSGPRGAEPTMRMPWDPVPSTAPPAPAQSDTPLTPGGLQVYFFHSEDSAPSREMKSLVARITAVPPGAELIEFDVKKKPALTKQMNIDRVPTCVFMRDGTELGRLDGAQTEHELRNAIRTILRSHDLPSVPVATPPREVGLVNPNARTETSADRVAKKFDAKTPAEEVKAAIETVAEAGAISGPVQIEMVPQDGETALVVRGPASSISEIVRNRANLRYEGKTFDEWRDAWRTELSTEKRVEAVKALAAFGAAASDAIELSDILMINAVKIVPKSPHSIESFDGLLIRVNGAPANAPIADAFVVDPEGKVDLGPKYGSVPVRGMSTDEARAAIQKHLVKRTANDDPLDEQIDVSVSLAFAAGAQQIVGEHLVGPDGRINLGTYGSVYVAGMTTDEARRAIEAQLANYLEDPDVVVDSLSNDRSRNYSREAAEAIITVASQYDWSKPTGNESLILLQHACLDAFGGSNGSLPAQLPRSEALSALLRAADSPAPPIREFAADALRYYARQDGASDAIAQLSRDKDADVNQVAWSTLVDSYTPDSPLLLARIREALSGDQPGLQIEALKAVWKYDYTKSGPQATNPAVRNAPEVFNLLFSDEPEVCRHARRALQRALAIDHSQIVEQLLEVLQDDSRSADHVKAIRALAALGPRAESAVDVLREVLVTDKNSLRIPAAAALQMILGARDFNKLLGETIAAELKVDVGERGTVSMRGQPDSQIFLDFSDAIEAERRTLFP